MLYSIHLIDESGKGSYLSVKGRTEWKTKKVAVKHAVGIMSAKAPVFGAVVAEIEDQYGRFLQVIRKGEV